MPAESESRLPAEKFEPIHDPYAAFRVPGYGRYFGGNIIMLLGMQMQATAVGWEIYERTRSNRALGLVGLIQFLPVLLLSLPAGYLADHFSRRRIVLSAVLVLALGSAMLAVTSVAGQSVWATFGCLLLISTARAIQQPAKASLIPLIVPRETYTNAVTWNSTGFQSACIAGPALAGILIAIFRSAALIYAIEAIASLIFFCLLWTVPIRAQAEAKSTSSPLRSLVAGLRFVWNSRIILATISLDLFAVLLGGATTLLPVFAKDILDLSAELDWVSRLSLPFADTADWDLNAVGLGCMRTAPAVGALAVALLMAFRRPIDKAGHALLWSVAGFGVATIVFGFSRSFWLSCGMLFLTGALDMVSVVIRHTLIQLRTPDEMRGRVQAVNGVFIGASNELGGFESGEVAHWFAREHDPAFGPTVSVVSGGFGTLVVVAIVAWLSPQLRAQGRMGEDPSEPRQTADSTDTSRS
ncbi:MAG: MFS transporter [Planctomyces sp.]